MTPGRRAHLAILAGLAIASLSGPSAIPGVALEPPHTATAEGVADPAADPHVRWALDYLERRRTGLTDSERDRVAHAIVREARRWELEPELVLAVIHVESRGNTFALSPVGAMGLMQILPSTGTELAQKHDVHWRGDQTLFDPVVNVRLGVAYLHWLAERYDNLPTALAAYNWGPGRIDRRLRRGSPLPVEYPKLVFDALEERNSLL